MTNTQNKALRTAIIAKFVTQLTNLGYVNPKFLIDYNPIRTLDVSSISLKYDSITNLTQLKQTDLKNQGAFEQDIKEKLFKELHTFFAHNSLIEEFFGSEGQIVLTPVTGIKYYSDAAHTLQISDIVSIPVGTVYDIYLTNNAGTTVGVTSLLGATSGTAHVVVTVVSGLNPIVKGVLA